MDNDNQSKTALTLYTVKFDIEDPIHECRDQGLFCPDGIRVAYVHSNFEVLYHQDYVDLVSQKQIKKNGEIGVVVGDEITFPKFEVEAKKSNRGRKQKEPKPKTKKKNGGNDTKFCDQITFGYICDGVVHGMKVFRTGSGNIYTISGEDYPLATRVANGVFDFINEKRPSTKVRLREVDIKMMNANFVYPLPESDGSYKSWVVNNYLLRNLLSSTDFVFIPIGDVVKPALIVYGAKTFMRIIVMFDGVRYNFNMYSSGKLYCYGGKCQFVMDEVMKFVFGFIDRNPQIVQIGMRTIQAKELAKLAKAN
jgi:hypothetical protein